MQCRPRRSTGRWSWLDKQVTKSLRSILEEEGPLTVRDLGRRYEAQCGCAFRASAGVAVYAFLDAHTADFAVARAQEGRSLPFKDVVSLRASEDVVSLRASEYKGDFERTRSRSATTSSAVEEPEPEQEGLSIPVPERSRRVKN